MLFEKYVAGEPKNNAFAALDAMMRGVDVGRSYADMIRYRLGGAAANECHDAYYVAHENGNAIARHWNGWGKHSHAIGNWGNFYTEEAYRGKGIGGKLLKFWWEDFHAREEHPLCFFCSAGTKELAELYSRFGFVPAMAGADRGPLYMPIGDSPSSFREFYNDYYKPSENIFYKSATVEYRHEIDCLLRFAFMDLGIPFGIGGVKMIETALLYHPQRAGIFLSDHGRVVGWSFDRKIQVHPLYSPLVADKFNDFDLLI